MGRLAALAVLAVLGAASACSGGAPASDASKANARGAAVEQGAPTSARRKVLFVGTSLTAGLGLEPDSAYPMLVKRKADSAGIALDVVNAGVSGETTAGLLRRIDWLLRGPADVIVVESGANDGLRGVPVSEARANLSEILRRVKAAKPQATVVLAQMESPPNLGARYTAEFRAMFPALAAEHGVVLMPFLLEGVAGAGKLNQADGIHPNEAGERIVAGNVWRALGPVLAR